MSAGDPPPRSAKARILRPSPLVLACKQGGRPALPIPCVHGQGSQDMLHQPDPFAASDLYPGISTTVGMIRLRPKLGLTPICQMLCVSVISAMASSALFVVRRHGSEREAPFGYRLSRLPLGAPRALGRCDRHDERHGHRTTELRTLLHLQGWSVQAAGPLSPVLRILCGYVDREDHCPSFSTART